MSTSFYDGSGVTSKGERGEKGEKGDQGDIGPIGPAATLDSAADIPEINSGNVQAALDERGLVASSDDANSNIFLSTAGILSPDRIAGALVGQANFGAGPNALANVTSGGNNTALGRSAGAGITSGGGNVAVGESALQYGSLCIDCTAVGHKALQNVTAGIGNTAVGKNSQEFTQNAGGNTSMGDSSMGDNLVGEYNSAYGYQALRRNTTGDFNVALGAGALFTGTVSNDSSAVGYNALFYATGSRNTALGRDAGVSLTSGTDNIFIGYGAGSGVGQKVNVINSIAIGTGAITTADNQVVIGALGTTQFLAYGEPWFDFSTTGFALGRVRNVNPGASAYAGMAVNAFGNSWAWRMGSTAANNNRLELVSDAVETPDLILSFATTGVSDYADDTAAAAGGVPVKGIYRTGSTLKIRVA